MNASLLAELQAVVLAYLRDARRAEDELATRRELAFQAVSTLCREALCSAGCDSVQQTEPTIPNATVSPPYPLLDSITRPTITTEEAAFYLNRKPQTLRAWACHEEGPIRPLRVNARLSWPVVEIKQLLDSASQCTPNKKQKHMASAGSGAIQLRPSD